MKVYWLTVIFFYCIWIVVSHLFPDPSWWSIFSSDRATHTPLIEQTSIVKVTLSILIFLGLAHLLQRKIQK
ncbi:hypothetical protein DZB84_16235 [Bacillus sp. HNG]|nr:hypothetical protein DZB84_16235 [Bacillus sp. HNG]